jgi:hypothetical protein
MRPRKLENVGLPRNLYPTSDGRNFQYVNPQTDDWVGMGSNRDEAIRAAKILNEQLDNTEVKVSDLVSRVLRADKRKTWGEHLDYMLTVYWPARRNGKGKPLSKETLKVWGYYVELFRKFFGPDTDPDKITLRQCADYLAPLPPRAQELHRHCLKSIFTVAIGLGVRTQQLDNPAEGTITKDYVVARQRMTLDFFNAVYEQAIPTMKNAMDLALQTLQREQSIVIMTFPEGTPPKIRLKQQKTDKRLEIEVLPPLAQIIKRCRDDVVSDYLIHFPKGTRKRKLTGKPVSEGWVQDQFQIARDLAYQAHPELFVVKLEDGGTRPMTAPERPTFHEIRSLGKQLYNKCGIDVNDLAGWEEDSKMPDLYDSRHEPKWLAVAAGLQL